MTLEEKLQNLPKDPGCYLMKDAQGRILYVGKAKNLKNRVSQYFHRGDQPIKTRALVEEIADFELMIAANEVEALLLERTLIKHHKPRFNILLRDDKEYPLVRVDFDETWPRLERVRRRKDDGAVYVGPFANSGVLNFMLNTVMRVFPLIRCSRHEFKTAQRPCNYYHIKMCLGPCNLPVDREHYVAMVRHAVALLQGKNRALLEELERKMKDAAKAHHFEAAANLRDQMQAIRRIGEQQVAVTSTVEDADAIALLETTSTYVFHVILVRGSMVVGGDNFILPIGVENREEALGAFLLQYYDRRLPPDRLLLPFQLDGVDHVLSAIGQRDGKKIKAALAKSAEEKRLLAMAEQNARHHLEERRAAGEKGRTRLEMLAELLHLDFVPRRIECIDISNLQGEAIVASDVCFVDAKPAKDQYRLYNVKSVTGAPDDFSSITEVVRRRLKRAQEEDDAPDLLVIDGGKGQLGAALKAAAEFPDLNVPIISLAKSRVDKDDQRMDAAPVRSPERVFVPGSETPYPLIEGSPPFQLLTQLRDEAHRFAISFHRKKRGKNLTRSTLDDIPGVGPTLRTRLLSGFGSVEAIAGASVEQLQTIKGVTEKTAIAILSFLNGEPET